MPQIRSEEITLVNVNELIPYSKNMNNHTDEQIDRLCKLIEFQGFRDPLIVQRGTNIIAAGHGRWTSAKKLGMEEVPVTYQEFENEAQFYAFVVSHNSIAKDSWASLDLAKVNIEMLDFGPEFDIDLLGIKDFVIEPAEKFEPQTDEDAVPEVEHPITRRGDVWLLGNHRVMCGDSTMIDNVEKLMNGEKADMVFTDPPYNIDYQDMGKGFDKIKNDKMSDEDFMQFLSDSIYWGSDTMYVCCSWQYSHLFKQVMTDMGKKPKAMIVWNKVNPAQNLDKYFKAHEIIFYYGKFGGQKTLRSDVWELKRQRNTVHPTMKPVEIMEMAIEDQPQAKLLMDSFLGSGSTLIACEQTNRKCYGMELDEKYCDVIIKRWEEYTGNKATLESTGQTYEELRVERDS